MDLKDYQKRALATLRDYLADAKLSGPSSSFDKNADEGAAAYKPIIGRDQVAVRELEQTPYVLLRIPTGGGKTILGAHIIRASEEYLDRALPLVLWLVPSKTIKSQTLDAFKNPRHPYRMELDRAFGGKVVVFDIADNGLIRPQDIADNVCLVIGTMATAKVTDTEIRDFYDDKEDLEPHFLKLGSNLPTLEMTKDGKRPKFSFANLLRIHRPLIITDEAHNENTGLAYEVYERLAPAAIVELTATPDQSTSNVLVRVSASELKAEHMIKLPVVLKEHTDGWEECLQAALQRREYLATLAPAELPDYIRPILLIQAEGKGGTATVDVVKTHLVENERIPVEHIKVATGEQRELDDVDLFDPSCPVTVIITVAALREGWDCSFAHVLCSVTMNRSGTAIEQLLGRVLRMPYARLRKHPDMNRAYAHVVSPAFGVVAQEFTDDLEAMGFNPVEAAQAVQPSMDLKGGAVGGLLPQTLVLTLPKAPDLAAIPAVDKPKVKVEPAEDNKGFVVTIEGQLDALTQDAIVEALPKKHQAEAKRRLVHHNIRAAAAETPASKQAEFRVPRLMMKQGALTLEVSADLLLDANGWEISEFPADLSSFRYNEQTRTFLVDLEGDEVGWEPSEEPQVAYMEGLAADWTERELVLFLDRRVRQKDINQAELVEWIRKGVAELTDRGFSLTQLVRGKFVLARKLGEQIISARQKASEKNYQTILFAKDASVEASMTHAYRFDPNSYPMRYPCPSNNKWKKHYYAVPGDLPHKRKDGSLAEEFLCALAIDTLPEAEFWVRNLVHKSQFSLPTSTGNTYPDFVVMLKDGRLLIVEYKGGDRVSNDNSKAKAQIGALWMASSGGKCVYLMATKKDDQGRDIHEQLRHAIET
jgi:type III restriction enzyme